MLRLPLIAAAVLSTGAATLTFAQGNSPDATLRTFADVTDIEWSFAVTAREGDGQPILRFARDGMNTTMGADELPEGAAALIAAAAAAPGVPVSFDVAHDAGAIACNGRTTAVGHAAGTCRFTPDQAFVAALAARGLVAEDEEELLGLALVDAQLASIDDLALAGMVIAEVDELITVAALDVTGAYARDLRSAGLEPADLDELVSAKAVGVSPAWVHGMAEAGFPDLDLDTAIALRALGVTPDYARRMARVMRATEGAE